MKWVAWKMLTGDKAKYAGIVFGVAFGTLLIVQQASIFVGLMRRTSHLILDVSEPNIWVMDPHSLNIDDIRPVPTNRLYQVRGVEGVDWAVRFFKGMARIRMEDNQGQFTGEYRQGVLVGIDDETLIGAPRNMLLGSLDNLRQPDSVVIDDAGYKYLFPNQPFELGRKLEMNDRRAVIVGICRVTPPFMTFPVLYSKYSQAIGFVPQERNVLSYVLAKTKDTNQIDSVCEKINKQTGLLALSSDGFFWHNINYYLRYTGIPVNFGITVGLGFFVGAAIAGQTFYLFATDNLKQFGSLKAMGVNNWRILGMIFFQAGLVGMMGFAIGGGLAAGYFEIMDKLDNPVMRGMYIPWQVLAVAAAAVGIIVTLAGLISARRLIVLEPAVVFK